eukprot:TRINITY_DN974_c0_g1_i1.p1 TRINITY_DN974_c0_g1~~TRINITY_DN974_c0_g1_i1.p1  ORF type:complete len:350 (-),score=81.62 TRINITY_DN974_c0_g1_i1:55-1032(-)
MSTPNIPTDSPPEQSSPDPPQQTSNNKESSRSSQSSYSPMMGISPLMFPTGNVPGIEMTPYGSIGGSPSAGTTYLPTSSMGNGLFVDPATFRVPAGILPAADASRGYEVSVPAPLAQVVTPGSGSDDEDNEREIGEEQNEIVRNNELALVPHVGAPNSTPEIQIPKAYGFPYVYPVSGEGMEYPMYANHNLYNQIMPAVPITNQSQPVIQSNINPAPQIDQSEDEGPPEPKYFDITPYLSLPQSQAAKKLNIPTSTLSKRWKEAVRGRKWPYRSICKLDKEIMTLLHNISHSEGESGSLPPKIEQELGELLRQRQEELKPVTIRL